MNSLLYNVIKNVHSIVIVTKRAFFNFQYRVQNELKESCNRRPSFFRPNSSAFLVQHRLVGELVVLGGLEKGWTALTIFEL